MHKKTYFIFFFFFKKNSSWSYISFTSHRPSLTINSPHQLLVLAQLQLTLHSFPLTVIRFQLNQFNRFSCAQVHSPCRCVLVVNLLSNDLRFSSRFLANNLPAICHLNFLILSFWWLRFMMPLPSISSCCHAPTASRSLLPLLEVFCLNDKLGFRPGSSSLGFGFGFAFVSILCVAWPKRCVP